jgi:uncharacterized heparinase superfamily protein
MADGAAWRTRAARSFAFARHIPPAKILRRVLLAGRGKVERAVRWAPVSASAKLAEVAPLPPLAQRANSARHESGNWFFTFIGRSETSPGEAIDWHLGGAGPKNQLWRMNLHYFEWVEGVDDSAFRQALIDWLAANPPFAPGARHDAWNSYALSLRVVVWLQQLAVRRGRLDPAWVGEMANACARQLCFLEVHLETDLGGNHLLKNIVALLWGSAALTGRDAPRWRTLGLKLLRRELAQFLPDGMHFERSCSYHAQALGDLLEIRHALRRDPFDGALDEVIGRAAQVLADLTHPDGGIALFGDSGLSMARSPCDLLEAARAITGRSYSPRASFDLPVAGYAGVRHGNDLLLIDAGPLEPAGLPAHVHGDMGSFEWSVAGQRIIVDQGVSTYVSGKERDESRSAVNHNTLAAPRADQGDFFGAFRLGARCRLDERSVELESDLLGVTVAHSGFVGSNGGPRHRRQIEARRGTIRIVDVINRPLPGAAISFLLAPEVEVVPDEGGVRLVTSAATCRISTDGELTVEAALWWPDMGTERSTKRIRVALVDLSCQTTLTIESRSGE